MKAAVDEGSSSSALVPCYVVNFRTSTETSTTLCVKRFTDKIQAESFAAEGPERQVHLHSVTLQAAAEGLSACQLLQRRACTFGLATASSHLTITNSSSSASVCGTRDHQEYPLLSRQATIEKMKSASSGDLAPRSPLKPRNQPTATPSEAVKPAAPKSSLSSGAAPLLVVTPTTPAASPESPYPTALPLAEQAAPLSNTTTSAIPPVASVPAMSEVQAPLPTLAVEVAPPKPKQRTLFDLMNKSAPSQPQPPQKRSRSESDSTRPAASTAPKQPQEKKAPAKPPVASTNLTKLAKASAKGNDVIHKAKTADISRMLVDCEDEDDSDDHDEEERRFLMASTSAVATTHHDAAESEAPPLDNPKHKKRGAGRAATTKSLGVIIPAGEDDAEDVVAVPCDDLELGDGAVLSSRGIGADDPADSTTDSKLPGSATPAKRSVPLMISPTGALPQKRCREEDPAPSPPPVPLGTALNAFFNADLIAFQKRFVKDHRTVQQIVNGEYVFNDEVFYRNTETHEELSMTEYQHQQRVMVEAFEKQKKVAAATASTATTASQQLPLSSDHPHDGDDEIKSKAADSKQQPPTTKGSKSSAGPQHKTLFSFFQKKL